MIQPQSTSGPHSAARLPLGCSLLLTAAFGIGVWNTALQCRAQTRTATEPTAAPTTQEQRRDFQSQELTTAGAFTFIFNPGQPPRVIWRDLEKVTCLGARGNLRVRWFDRDLHETAVPRRPGRWAAYVEGVAPNGTPVRRAMTFYCRPPGFFLYWPSDYTVPLAPQAGPISADVWREHEEELSRAAGEMFLRTLNDSETGAILIAGLAESKAQGRPARNAESAAALNEDFHLALKLKVQGLSPKVRPLNPPRKRVEGPTPVLHESCSSEAGISADTKARIDAVCTAWAQDSAEPFVALVAHRGAIITHSAFGRDRNQRPISLDYRADVASITKVPTAILFSLFLDQGLIRLDDPISTVFPDYSCHAAHVPTFRQCFTHMSGLSGHGDFGGCRNPHLENVILNGIEVNQPGKAYIYSGTGFELAAKAMEIVSGKSWQRLLDDHLFRLLGIGDVPLGGASSGARFTARELALLAQWMANRGSYGDIEFISPATFEQLLPEPLNLRYPGVMEVEGIGNHWMKPLRPGAPAGSTNPQDLILSPRTIGHGSLSGCTFLIDLDRELVIVQVRRQLGPRYGEWFAKFLQTISDSVASSAPQDVRGCSGGPEVGKG